MPARETAVRDAHTEYRQAHYPVPNESTDARTGVPQGAITRERRSPVAGQNTGTPTLWAARTAESRLCAWLGGNGSAMVPVILPRLAPRPVLVRVRALSAVGVFMTVGVFVLVRVAVLRAVRVRVLVRVLVPTFYPQGIWDYEVHPSLWSFAERFPFASSVGRSGQLGSS